MTELNKQNRPGQYQKSMYINNRLSHVRSGILIFPEWPGYLWSVLTGNRWWRWEVQGTRKRQWIMWAIMWFVVCYLTDDSGTSFVLVRGADVTHTWLGLHFMAWCCSSRTLNWIIFDQDTTLLYNIVLFLLYSGNLEWIISYVSFWINNASYFYPLQLLYTTLLYCGM